MSPSTLTALPPLVSADTRLLVLGSFPGLASLQAQQYYGHPRNHFWPIMEALLPASPQNTGASSYHNRSEWLLRHKIGVWDVYAACDREGSLDSDIRNAVLNDFSMLKMRCPDLQAVVHNGAESFRHSKYVIDSLVGEGVAARRDGPPLASAAPSGGSVLHEVKSMEVHFHKLPSTSPANASWSFERKLAAWREVFEKYGLV